MDTAIAFLMHTVIPGRAEPFLQQSAPGTKQVDLFRKCQQFSAPHPVADKDTLCVYVCV